MICNVFHVIEATRNMNPNLSTADAVHLVLAGLDDAELLQVREGLFDLAETVEQQLLTRQEMREVFQGVNS